MSKPFSIAIWAVVKFRVRYASDDTPVSALESLKEALRLARASGYRASEA
jgi:hypothetical protein